MGTGNLSTAQVARMAGVHRDTLLRWLREQIIPEPGRDHRGWRVFTRMEAEEISRFAKSGIAPSRDTGAVKAELARLDSIDWNFLDAKTLYLTHGLHPYPAKFIPQIPNALIQELSSVGETVADIFCGSGTTLVEALTLKRHALGLDANPLACLISEAKTMRFSDGDADKLNSLVAAADQLARSISQRLEYPLFKVEPFKTTAARPDADTVLFWFEPFVVEELAEILSWCRSLPTDSSKKVALAALSSIIVNVSKQDSDTRYVRRSKNIQPGDTLRRFARALEDAIRRIKELTELVEPRFTCKLYHCNILERPTIGNVDLVVCSPPYPNAYSYHLYHMTRMLWLGLDQLTFKKVEIGSHRKYSRPGRMRATIETFAAEMKIVFAWLSQWLRPGRYACFVVGDSIIDGEKFDNAEIISSCAQEEGFIEVKRIHRQLQERRKAFNPAYGKIKTEDVLILQNASRVQS